MESDVNIAEGRARALGKTLAPGGAVSVAIAAAVGLLAIASVVFGLYWSNEPRAFDVRENAARFAERQGRPVVVGTATTATLVGVAETLLHKPGGYLSNDRLPPGVLLDNMPNHALRESVALAKGHCWTEASGGVSLSTVRGIAETGVDRISVGAITHSAPSLDLALDFE